MQQRITSEDSRRQFKRDVTNVDDWESKVGGLNDISLTDGALSVQS